MLTKTTLRSLVVGTVVASVLVSGISNVLLPSPAFADIANPQDNINTLSEKWLYYRAILACFDGQDGFSNTDNDSISNSDLNSGKLFDGGGKSTLGYLGKESSNHDGTIECNKSNYIDAGIAALGWSSGVAMICAMNKHDPGRYITPNGSSCENSDSFKVTGSRAAMMPAFKAAVNDLPGHPPYDPSGEMWYWITRRSLEEFCGGGKSMDGAGQTNTTLNSSRVVSAHLVDPNTGKVTRINYALNGVDENTTINDVYYAPGNTGTGGDDRKCYELAAKTRDHSATYSNYIIRTQAAAIQKSIQDQIYTDTVLKAQCGEAMPADCVNAFKLNVNSSLSGCVKQYSKAAAYDERYSNIRNCLKSLIQSGTGQASVGMKKPTKTAILAALDASTPEQIADPSSTNSAPQDNTSTCAIDGIGWIVCPLMNFVAKLNDKAFSFIQRFLQIEPELLTQDASKTAWQTFLNFANIAFIIVFLIIIYSQISGAGVSNYGIKKILPRIIVAAILVNASYYLCQIAVDLSNILGASIYNLFVNIPVGPDGKTAGGLEGAWEGLVGAILAAAAFIAILAVMIFAPMTLLAFAVAVLILIARKAFLIILVVISPLAFVAYLLPNTEQWFKKWWKALSTLLMLYPIIGAVFGGSVLASNILMQTAECSGADCNGDDKQMLAIVALAVLGIPLFAVPSLVKGALSAAGSIGARIGKLQDMSNKGALNSAKNGRLGEAWGAHQARRQQNKVGARMGKGRMTRVGGLLEKRGGKIGAAVGSRMQKYDVAKIGAEFDKTPVGSYLGGTRGAAAATAAYHKAAGEEVDRQQTLLSEKSGNDLVEMLEKGGMSTEQEAAVHRQIAKVGGDKHVQKAVDHMMRTRDSGGAHARDVQQLSAEALLKRKPSGMGSEDANKLINGSLGEGTNGVEGYKDLLQERVQKGKFGAKDYAAMGKDDLIRLGELSKASKLSGGDILKMNAEFTAIENDETLKGTLTDERRALYKSILDGGGPRGADGSDYSIKGPTAL